MTDYIPKVVAEPWVDVKTTMNQTYQLMYHIAPILRFLERSVDFRTLYLLVTSNQNPHCGGDGSMSVEQWEAAMEVKNGVRALIAACQKFLNAPLGPAIRDLHPGVPKHPSAPVTPPSQRSYDDIFGDDDIPF